MTTNGLAARATELYQEEAQSSVLESCHQLKSSFPPDDLWDPIISLLYVKSFFSPISYKNHLKTILSI